MNIPPDRLELNLLTGDEVGNGVIQDFVYRRRARNRK